MSTIDCMEQLGPYKYRRDPACFPLGRDSLELGAFTTVRNHWRVCDLGCGGGVLLLLLAGRAQGLELTGIELLADAAAAARENLARNGLTGQIIHGDLREALLPAGGWELVISNPPYFSVGSGGSGGGTRMEENGSLKELCASAARLLKNGGRFALVQRPERLPELFGELRGHGLEPKRMRLLQHDLKHAPSAVLVESVKGGRPGLELLPVCLNGTCHAGKE